MTRKTITLAITLLAMTMVNPARAFCINNKSQHVLRVHMETQNPFGRFAVLFKPNTRGCCSWFHQRCNPTGKRDGLLTFSVRSKSKAKNKVYCATGWMKRVYGTANGEILITESPGSMGGLNCDSRDSFKRRVTQQTYYKRKRRGMPPPIIVPPPPE